MQTTTQEAVHMHQLGGCTGCTPAFLTMREECAKLSRQVRVVRAGPVTEVMETHRHPMPDKRGAKGARPPVRKACSSLRAKRMVRWLSAGNGEPGTAYFFTATFSDDVQDYDEALSRWKKFRRLLRAEFEDMRYVAVPEIQPRSGRWHFHAIFCGLPEAGRLRQVYGHWQRHFTLLWSKANGHSGASGDCDRADIEVARSVAGVCGYLIKYLNKDVGGVVPAGRRNYFAGGPGLVRPLALEGADHIPDGVPVFAAVGKDRKGFKTVFSRYVETV